jgi:hypothetical protein
LKTLIATGWYCTKSNQDRIRYGDDIIRGEDFQEIWDLTLRHHNQINEILVVESKSEVPFPNKDPVYNIIKLPINLGHSVNHIGEYSGWHASVIIGIEYALMGNYDYFVYIEQDVLTKGHHLINDQIRQMNGDFAFGSGQGTPQPLQQSFFILKKNSYKKFLSRLHCLNPKDSELSPEWKFLVASSNLFYIFNCFYQLCPKKYYRYLNKILIHPLYLLTNPNYLKVKYGRSRPINFNSDYLYFQHGERNEIFSYINSLDFELIKKIKNTKFYKFFEEK